MLQIDVVVRMFLMTLNEELVGMWAFHFLLRLPSVANLAAST